MKTRIAILLLLITTANAEVTALKSPDSLVTLLNNLGVVYAREQAWDSAEVYFDMAHQRQVRSAKILNNLGCLYLINGKTELSLTCFTDAWTTDSTCIGVLYNWGVALYASGLTEAATAKFEFLLSRIGNDLAVHETLVKFLASENQLLKREQAKFSRTEIEQLLSRAKERLRASVSKLDSLRSQTKDSTAVVADSARRPDRLIVPAGGKSAELSGLSSIVYWMLL